MGRNSGGMWPMVVTSTCLALDILTIRFRKGVCMLKYIYVHAVCMFVCLFVCNEPVYMCIVFVFVFVFVCVHVIESTMLWEPLRVDGKGNTHL